MDVVLEALKLYKTRKKFDLGELLKYAKICRVEKVMRPYLEATVRSLPETSPHPSGNVSSTAPRATDGHSTSCFNTTPWSDSSTGYPNPLTPTDSFSKEL
jgi:hypothetical protein